MIIVIASEVFSIYNIKMKRKSGRPKKDREKAKGELLQVRLEPSEKQGFSEAADIAGIALSAWVRERLRLVAREELGRLGRTVPFIN
jgi:predicted HicB family RNase H-like nuclease